MSEHVEKLRATLADLHAELAGIEHLDPEARALLDGAVEDIQRALAAAEGSPGGAPGRTEVSAHRITDRLRQAARHFEETHPTLAGAVGSVIDALARMGI